MLSVNKACSRTSAWRLAAKDAIDTIPRSRTWFMRAIKPEFVHRSIAKGVVPLDAAIGTPKEHCADRLEDKVRQPKDQMRKVLSSRFQRLPENEEAVIEHHQHQGHGNP